jgi:hypothetical protein
MRQEIAEVISSVAIGVDIGMSILVGGVQCATALQKLNLLRPLWSALFHDLNSAIGLDVRAKSSKGEIVTGVQVRFFRKFMTTHVVRCRSV